MRGIKFVLCFLFLLLGSTIETYATCFYMVTIQDAQAEKDQTDANEQKDSTALLSGLKTEVGKYFEALGRLFPNEQHSIQQRTYISNTKDTLIIEQKQEVFGFHPYWLNKTYTEYDFKTLSAVSFFDYALNPDTGSYVEPSSIQNWRKTELISRAKTSGCKVYLTVTNFTRHKNARFLSAENIAARNNSIDSIHGLLLERQAHGVTINFENIPKRASHQFTEYIKQLSARLKTTGMKVVVTLPPIYDDTYDIKAIKDDVEFFIVMGKNYYGDWSDIAGPVSPLRSGALWKEGSIVNSITTYLDEELPKEQLILSLPYYGNKWQLSDTLYPPQRPYFIENLQYRTIKNNYPQEPKYDTISATAYLDVLSKDGKKIQIWFDDAKTLGEKYDYIKEKELAGVGIWALGYDDGYPELWQALDEKFGGKTITKPKERTLLSYLANVSVLKAGFYLILTMLTLGFLLSLRDPDIREIVFKHSWVKLTALLAIPTLLLGLLFWQSYFIQGVFLFAGIALGYVIYYLFDRTEELSNNIKRIP